MATNKLIALPWRYETTKLQRVIIYDAAGRPIAEIKVVNANSEVWAKYIVKTANAYGLLYRALGLCFNRLEAARPVEERNQEDHEAFDAAGKALDMVGRV